VNAPGSKAAEAQLAAAQKELARVQAEVTAKRLELAAVRSKQGPVEAELARIKALPTVTSDDLVAQTNAERKLGKLQHDEGELESLVTDAEGGVKTAAEAVKRAEHALANARFAEYQETLLRRFVEMEAEAAQGLETLRKLGPESGVSPGAIAAKLLAGRERPLTSPLVFAGEALRLARDVRELPKSAA